MVVAAFGLAAAPHQAVAAGSADVDQTCTRAYDPVRGVHPKDCYPRQEAEKFLCLNVNPQNGPVSSACSDPKGQLPLFLAQRKLSDIQSNANIISSNPSKDVAVIVEREGNGYMVRGMIDHPRFNNPHNPAIPAWALASKNSLIAGNYNPEKAQVSCEVSKFADACNPHDFSVSSQYKHGDRIVMGGTSLVTGSNGKLEHGKYTTVSLSTDGSMTLAATDKYGARRLTGGFYPTTVFSRAEQFY